MSVRKIYAKLQKIVFYLIYLVFLCLKYLFCPPTKNTLLPLKALENADPKIDRG